MLKFKRNFKKVFFAPAHIYIQRARAAADF